jgi:hypothetical protein
VSTGLGECQFIIGKEMGGLHAANAMKAFAALKSMLLKFKSS